MAFYDPIQQARSANIMAAQYGMQQREAEEEDKRRTKTIVGAGKTGYYGDLIYRTDQRTKVADMMTIADPRTDTKLKYRRKEFEKPESWKEWLSQRYAKAEDMVEREPIVRPTDPTQSEIIEGDVDIPSPPKGNQDYMEKLGKDAISSRKEKLMDEISPLGPYVPQDLSKFPQLPDEKTESQFLRQTARSDLEQRKMSIVGKQQSAGEFRQQAKKDIESYPKLTKPDQYWTPQEIGVKTDIGRDLPYGGKSREYDTSYWDKYGEQFRKDADIQKTIQSRWNFGNQQPFGKFRSVKGMAHHSVADKPKEVPFKAPRTDDLGPAKSPFTDWTDPRGKGGVSTETIEAFKGSSDYDPNAAGSALNQYFNKHDAQKAAKDAAAAAAETAGETVSDAGGDAAGEAVGAVGTGLKVGATLLSSKGQTSEQLFETGVDTGLDYLATQGILSGNPYAMAAGGAYKLYDFLT